MQIPIQNKVAYIATEETITIILDGQNRTVQIRSKAHRNDVIIALERYKKSQQTAIDRQILEEFLAPIKRIVVAGDARFELDLDGKQLFLAGTKTPMPAKLSDKILEFLEEGLPVDPMIKFWDSCLRNPHYIAVEELFQFLEENHLPITDDGAFLGYKKLNFVSSGPRIDIPDDFEELIVAEDGVTVKSVSGGLVPQILAKKYLEFINEANNPVMVDVHSGTIKQKVGEIVRIDRVKLNEVERRNSCGYGLHIGAYSYAFHGHVRVLCKVFPEDVIACNEGQAKLRTCKYQIVSFVDSDKEVKDLLVGFNKTERNIVKGIDQHYDNEHNPFLPEQEVICIDEFDADLSEDESYTVLDIDNGDILIVDDNGETNWYDCSRFTAA